MEAVDAVSVFGRKPGQYTLFKLGKELFFQRKIVIKALNRTIRCEFGIKLGLMPDIELGSAFQIQHKEDNKHDQSTDNPVDEGLYNMLDQTDHECKSKPLVEAVSGLCAFLS